MPTPKSRSISVILFGLVGTVWFALHAFEYVVARYDGLATSITLPDGLGLAAFLDVLPGWASIAVTLTIWLGLLGSVLLLLRDRASVLVLSLTLLAALVVLIWGAAAELALLTPLGGIDPLFFGAGQFAVTLSLWLYARATKRVGKL